MALIKKKKLLFLLCIIVIAIVLGGYFIYQSKRDMDQALVVKYIDSNSVILKNILPLTDIVGKSITIDSARKGTAGYVEFIILNRSSKPLNYEIYLIPKNNSEYKVNDKYIKLYLSNENKEPYSGFDTNILPTYSELPILSDLPSGRLLYTGKLKGFGTEKMYFRSWIADNYGKYDESEKFEFYVNVKVKKS